MKISSTIKDKRIPLETCEPNLSLFLFPLENTILSYPILRTRYDTCTYIHTYIHVSSRAEEEEKGKRERRREEAFH